MPSAASSITTSVSTRLKRILGWVMGLLVMAWAVVFLAWGAIHIFIVPRIDEYRLQIEQQASKAMGIQMRIGSIQAKGSWLVPWLEIQDIQLFDRQGQEALFLPQVTVAVSPRSVLMGQLEQLVIEQPELQVRRDAQGQVWVAGLNVSDTEGDSSGADWLFSQRQVVVHQGTLTWRDETRTPADGSSPQLVLSQLDLFIQNSSFRHNVRLDAVPPAALAKPLQLRGKFTQAPWARAGDTRTWQGELYAELQDLAMGQLTQWVSLGPQVSLPEGRGALRIWTDVANGQALGVTADVLLDAVDLRLTEDTSVLGLRHVQGRVGGSWAEGEWVFNTHDLMFDTTDGERWPGGDLRLTAQGDDLLSGTFSAERLDLGAIAQIAQRLPLPESVRETMHLMQPKGQVNQLSGTWQLSDDQHIRYTARGYVRQLFLLRDARPDSPLAQVPGLENAQIEFDLSEKSGKARMGIQDGSVTLAQGLDEPHIALEDASVQLAWQIKGNAVAVQVKKGIVVNDDVAGDFSGEWHSGEGTARWPGVLDLTANISRAKLSQVTRYLPNTLSSEVRTYLRDSITQGEATRATLRLRGDLQHMPFDDPKLGEFRVSAQLTHGHYAYVPPAVGKKPSTTELAWPALTEVNGELVIDRKDLRFKGSTQLEGAPHVTWQKVDAHIPNLMDMTVSVNGEAHGPVPEVLAVIAKSALNDLTSGVLAKSEASGDADFKLNLVLPIDHLSTTQVKGSAKFAGNDLQVIPGTPVLKNARGTLTFSERGFELQDMKANLLGGDVTLKGGLVFDVAEDASPLKLNIKGKLTSAGLQQARELGFVSRLAKRSSGVAQYDATLGLRRGRPELLITSDLQGMALTLPAPMNKTAKATLPVRVQMQLTPESVKPKARALQDQIQVTVGNIASVNYVRDLSGPNVRVLRGNIAVGQDMLKAATMADTGVSLYLKLPLLDVDAWNEATRQVTGVALIKAPKRKTKTKSKTAAVGSEAVSDGGDDYIPNVVALLADQVKVTDRVLNHVVVGGTRTADLWRLNVSADELNGAVEVRAPQGDTPAQLYVRLAYLNIPPSLVPDVERMLSEQPSSIPTLDIVVNELTLRDIKLGRLQIDAINRIGQKTAREWHLNTFNLTMPEASLTANGSWMADGPRQRRTQLNFVLAMRNSGELLDRLGTRHVIRNGEGRLEGQVAWVGSPITLDYPSMSGKLNLLVEKGQFLKTEPGAARLLGILNLQALPRRLTLDFSDVFSEGFAFDFVRGDVRIDQGVASTNNLQMKGVVAGALIEGSADLDKETQDLKVVVVPEINAGTASLYMATINPLVGLTSYLAQLILSKPLVSAGTSQFHIDGTWSNPRVTKVE